MGLSGSSQSSSGDQTVTNNPPDYVAPYLSEAAQAASELYNSGGGYSYYPESTVVGLSDQTQNALNLTEQRALNGSAANTAAQNQVAATASGDYLNGNSYLQDAIDNASQATIRNYQEAVAPTIDSNYARAGRYGSGLYANAQDTAQQNLSSQLGDIAQNMSYDNYNDERSRQLQASALAPTVSATDYTDLEALAGVGSTYEAQDAAYLQENIDRYNYANNADQMALDDYISRLNGAGGTYGTSTSTVSDGTSGGSTLAGALGGGMSGASIGATFGPYGALIGGGLGALTGLFA